MKDDRRRFNFERQDIGQQNKRSKSSRQNQFNNEIQEQNNPVEQVNSQPFQQTDDNTLVNTADVPTVTKTIVNEFTVDRSAGDSKGATSNENSKTNSSKQSKKIYQQSHADHQAQYEPISAEQLQQNQLNNQLDQLGDVEYSFNDMENQTFSFDILINEMSSIPMDEFQSTHTMLNGVAEPTTQSNQAYNDGYKALDPSHKQEGDKFVPPRQNTSNHNKFKSSSDPDPQPKQSKRSQKFYDQSEPEQIKHSVEESDQHTTSYVSTNEEIRQAVRDELIERGDIIPNLHNANYSTIEHPTDATKELKYMKGLGVHVEVEKAQVVPSSDMAEVNQQTSLKQSASIGEVQPSSTDKKADVKKSDYDFKTAKGKRLAEKDTKINEKLAEVRENQPTQKKAIRRRIYDEEKERVQTKFKLEHENVSFNDAKWNKSKKNGVVKQSFSKLSSEAHQKISEVEHENVGTQTAHTIERGGEKVVRGGSKLIKGGYRYYKNTPYRQLAKLEKQSQKNRGKLEYQKILEENPDLKFSRFQKSKFQKMKFEDGVKQVDPLPTKTLKSAKTDSGMITKVSSEKMPEKTKVETTSKIAKPSSKLQFSKEEQKIEKLEGKLVTTKIKLDEARTHQPKKRKLRKKQVYNEEKKKATTKLTFAKEELAFEDAKWNKKDAIPKRLVKAPIKRAWQIGHQKMSEVEGENIGVKTAHAIERVGEKTVKEVGRSAYRFHKNRPYRKINRLEKKFEKRKSKLQFRRVVHDKPVAKKSNLLSRAFQKRRNKRKLMATLKGAKSATGVQKVGAITRAVKFVVGKIAKNPAVLAALAKGALLLLMAMMVLMLLNMCMSALSGTVTTVVSMSYQADYDDLTDASVMYTRLETDLAVRIANIEITYTGWDEYRFEVDSMGHDPFMLMAYLTAVYGEFTYAEVQNTIQQIFNQQNQLSFQAVTEVRWRWEQVGWSWEQVGWNWEQTGWSLEWEWVAYSGCTIPIIMHPDGGIHWQYPNPPLCGWEMEYEWTPVMGWVPEMAWVPVYDWVSYNWHILYTRLNSRPFADVIADRINNLTADEQEHFEILMETFGLRQFVANPFDFDWRPNITSLFGYRIHPINFVPEFHTGIDLGIAQGTPFTASFDGVVVTAAYNAGGYGNFVIIDNGEGIRMLHAHAHQLFVTAGQTVIQGQVIGTIGTTGASTGPHAHIEIFRNGQLINPIFFMEFEY